MDTVDLVPRFVGLFYLAAGFFGLRAIVMDSVLDKALAALTLQAEERRERLRRHILGVSTIGVGAGGVALLLMSFWALPLFLANLCAQAIWLAGARRLVIAPEDDDPQSARQLVRATLLYAVVTLGVVWLWRSQRLGPWDDPLAASLVLATAIGLGGWFFHNLAWEPAGRGFAGGGAEEDEARPQRIVIDPARWFWPLIDADSGERFNHLTELEEGIGWRIEHWDDVFQNAFDPEDETTSATFASPAEEAAYRAEGAAIADTLRQIYGAGNVTFGERWTGAREPGA